MSNMAVDVFARTLALASLGNGGGGSAVDTYTKAEIDKMFGEAGTVQVEAVDVLPTEDIKENVIYLVPNGSTGENYYNECMYINGKWEVIGTTEIDLSSYATKEELEEIILSELKEYVTKTNLADNYYNKDEVVDQLEAKQDTLTAGEGISIVNNVISATSGGESSVAVFEGTQEEYDALSDEEKAKYTIAVIDDGEEV